MCTSNNMVEMFYRINLKHYNCESFFVDYLIYWSLGISNAGPDGIYVNDEVPPLLVLFALANLHFINFLISLVDW